jgi:hypothetical protein
MMSAGLGKGVLFDCALSTNAAAETCAALTAAFAEALNPGL